MPRPGLRDEIRPVGAGFGCHIKTFGVQRGNGPDAMEPKATAESSRPPKARILADNFKDAPPTGQALTSVE